MSVCVVVLIARAIRHNLADFAEIIVALMEKMQPHCVVSRTIVMIFVQLRKFELNFADHAHTVLPTHQVFESKRPSATIPRSRPTTAPRVR